MLKVKQYTGTVTRILVEGRTTLGDVTIEIDGIWGGHCFNIPRKMLVQFAQDILKKEEVSSVS